MTLSSGTRLGPYEILSPIGAGGMGEVYKARDTRLGRDVAIKVLSTAIASSAESLMRFERESRSASALSDPHIVTVFDVGVENGIHYFASEFVEGGDLRSRLGADGLPVRKALEIAEQIASGLAAAHEKGITHRDLKPENILLTKTGVAKIADFGLAKLSEAPGAEFSQMPTAGRVETTEGVVMGTVSYMSPEQASGRKIDYRSDQFSFGQILFEMLTGRSAFRRETQGETLAALLRDEPPKVAELNPSVPAPLAWIVERCLARDPDERYASTRDLAREISNVRRHISEMTSGRVVAGAASAPGRGRGAIAVAFGLGALLLVAAAAFFAFGAGERNARRHPPAFRRLTFQRGQIQHARFTPDGQTIVYGASWEGRPVELFSLRVGSPESRALGIMNADVTAISSTGELVLIRKDPFLISMVGPGMLSTVSMSGGAPRDLEDGVHAADWLASGELAVQRHLLPSIDALEMPLGHRIFEYTGPEPRVSPDGRQVAVARNGDESAELVIVGRDGRTRSLATNWVRIVALAWRANDEVWVQSRRSTGERGIFAVTLGGAVRTLTASRELGLQDVDRQGRLLATRELNRTGLRFRGANDNADRDLSWLDNSTLSDVSDDCRTVLFSETGDGGGQGGAVYARSSSGDPPVRLGDGKALALSSDAHWALVGLAKPSFGFRLIPLGAGEARELPPPSFPIRPTWAVRGAASLPGDRPRFVALAQVGDKDRHALLIEAEKPVRDLGTVGREVAFAASPDGKFLAGQYENGEVEVRPIEGGKARTLPGTTAADFPIQWSGDGRFLFLRDFERVPVRIARYEIATGSREPWLELAPQDRSGLIGIGAVALSRDGRCFAYNTEQVQSSDLFLVEGLK